jgi:hypothetical protein
MKELKMEKTIEEYIKKRDELFRNPTLEAATEFFKGRDIGGNYARLDVPLASVHKARLHWIEATDEMLEESKRWLIDHKYDPTFQGAQPYTPEKRDEERAQRGLPPLKRDKNET